MHFVVHAFLLLKACTFVLGAILHQEIISSFEISDLRGSIGRTASDDLEIPMLIPLHPEARTGLIPYDVEEGILSALGPRFLNKLLELAVEEQRHGTTNDLKCVFKCGSKLVQLAPCIPPFLATKNPAALLPCLSKDQICTCAECLPDVVSRILKDIGFCTSSFDSSAYNMTVAEDEAASLQAYIPYSQLTPYLQGLRGDLRVIQSNRAADLARAFCPGIPCGSCKCCLGVCPPPPFDKCIGACLD